MLKILLILTLFASPVYAMNKCVVDGKTIYTQHPCAEGTDKEIKGAFSVNETSGVRRNIVIDEQKKAIAAENAAKLQAEQAKQIKDQALQDQLNRIERKTNKAARDSAAIRSQQVQDNFKKIFQ